MRKILTILENAYRCADCGKLQTLRRDESPTDETHCSCEGSPVPDLAARFAREDTTTMLQDRKAEWLDGSYPF